MNTGIIVFIKNLAPLFLYGTWIILCFYALSGKVKFGLFFLAALFPLQNVIDKLHQFPLGKDFNDIIIICMILGWLIRAGMKKEKLFEKTVFNPLLLVMFFYTYFSLWQATGYLGAPIPVRFNDPRVQTWKNYVMFFFIFWLVLNNIKSLKDMKRMFFFLMCSMFLINYYTVNQVRWAGSIESRTKFSGTFSYLGANEVAALYATYTFIMAGVFWLLSFKKKWAKVGLAFLVSQNIYVVLMLFSRGAYAAFFAGSLFFSFMKKKWLLIPLIIAALSWQVLLPEKVVERVQQTTDEYGHLDTSNERRFIMWEQSMDLFRQNPVFGVGFNVFPYIGFELGDTHNVFVKFLAEQGIIGTSLLLMLLGMAFWRGRILYRTAKDPFLKGLGLGFACCVVAIFVGNMFGDRWTHTPLGAWFWVFLGMVERGNVIVARGEEGLEEKDTKKSPNKDKLLLRYGKV